MNTRLLFGGTISIGTIAVLLGTAIFAEDPKPDLNLLNAMDACQNPQNVATQTCTLVQTLEGEGKCLGHTVGVCSGSLAATLNAQGAAACPQCVNGTCACSKVTQEKPYGTCTDVDASAGYNANPCTQCDFLVCAMGTGYPSCDDCNNNINACSAAIAGFKAGACKVAGP